MRSPLIDLKTPFEMDVAPWGEHRIMMVFDGNAWYLMIFAGTQWYCMALHCIVMVFDDIGYRL